MLKNVCFVRESNNILMCSSEQVTSSVHSVKLPDQISPPRQIVQSSACCILCEYLALYILTPSNSHNLPVAMAGHSTNYRFHEMAGKHTKRYSETDSGSNGVSLVQ